MATERLAVGATAATSADITVADGASMTLCLKGGVAGQATDGDVVIEMKDDATGYWPVDALSLSRQAVVVSGPGTFRLSRRAGKSCGVFSG